jgi:hypothetical protein
MQARMLARTASHVGPGARLSLDIWTQNLFDALRLIGLHVGRLGCRGHPDCSLPPAVGVVPRPVSHGQGTRPDGAVDAVDIAGLVATGHSGSGMVGILDGDEPFVDRGYRLRSKNGEGDVEEAELRSVLKKDLAAAYDAMD